MIGETVMRFLQYGEIKVDYSILAVMVCTLGLILIVELVRHHIDHKAEDKPFFKSVLTSVYSELSTLGIVEAAIYVLHSYYAGLDVPKEKVFAYCHFLLFFTAIFNALQSCIQAFFAVRVSNKLWVKTEELELHHYVAIREEFDILEKEVNEMKASGRTGKMRSFFRYLSNPVLYRKYKQLMVQVRFHELRLHFLQANALPLKLKVSEYLKSSEVAILCHLTHVTAFAWILLTSAANLGYYVLGIVIHVADAGNGPTTKALAYIYVGTNVSFALLSMVLYLKMNWIFNKIMKMQFIDVGVTTSRLDRDQYSNMKKKQLQLFWGGHPSYFVGLIQFMQFGYAISAAILIIFWKKIKKDGFLPPSDLLITLLVCYSVYVLVVAEVLPKYTMCTSLGALVDRKRLKDMTTKYKLEEAIMASLQETSKDTGGRTTVSESDDSTIVSTKLSNIAELVQTKTTELRSSRSLMAGDISAADAASLRKSRRKKAYSDSRSIAMMRMYGRPGTIQENNENPYIDQLSKPIARSGSNTDLSHISMSSLGDQASSYQIDGNPDHPVKDESPPLTVNIADTTTLYSPPTQLSLKGDVSKPVEVKTPIQKLRSFLVSSKFRIISELIGTMGCFFLVGMRVEIFALAEGVIYDLETTFQLTVEASFWFLIVWLAALILSSFLTLFLAGRESMEHRLGAFFDILLVSMCLVFMILAELERCCDAKPLFEDDPGCCDRFGTRTFGGLGTIEPFTALVALRVFRLFAARKFLDKSESSDASTDGSHGASLHDSHDKKMVHVKGTIIDLWQHAITLYPDIVDNQGEFSGALFKAMLGINVDPAAEERLDQQRGMSAAALSNEAGNDGDDTNIGDLVAPDAKLILPMRRCDWMLPPLLDHWRTVDVVMTVNEIVILEAVNDMTSPSWRKIIATHGGVGLRLREVLKGRRILGHVNMTSIDVLNVERFPPVASTSASSSSDDSDAKVQAMEHGQPGAENLWKDEFWSVSPPTFKSTGTSSKVTSVRWRNVFEDQLKIHSADSSTYLRFYCDLQSKEAQPNLPPAKVAALHWCRIIGRGRGSNNLAQKLPNFGAGDDSELFDYLIETQRGSEDHHQRGRVMTWAKKIVSRPSFHRSTSSTVEDKAENNSKRQSTPRTGKLGSFADEAEETYGNSKV